MNTISRVNAIKSWKAKLSFPQFACLHNAYKILCNKKYCTKMFFKYNLICLIRYIFDHFYTLKPLGFQCTIQYYLLRTLFEKNSKLMQKKKQADET